MPAVSRIAISGATETIYFRECDGLLRQVLHVSIAADLPAPRYGRAEVRAGGETATTLLAIAPGDHDYAIYAPVLWPQRSPQEEAPLIVRVDRKEVRATVPVGHHRPWTIYLLSDVCTDYTWVYADEGVMRGDDARLLLTELDLAESTAGAPVAERNHYNLVHAREIAFFLERYPDQAERLWEHIRQGTVTLNPFYNMALTSAMSLEELVRQFYPARRWAQAHALEWGYANHQETPTITWSLASLLSACGIGHLVKTILPYECPWVSRLQEPPLFAWEGPDGARILVRLRTRDYMEGAFVLRGLQETVSALHQEVIPRYERLGSTYPFDCLAIVGCYGDLSAESPDKARRKVQTIQAYNAQGWEYPRLVNASHRQFWDDLEHQIAARNIQVPVVRGDYGTSWEAWPACMARDLAAWRRAQERAVAADALAAMTVALGLEPSQPVCDQLTRGWENLLSLSDHAWNGANPDNLKLNASLRRRWQTEANAALDTVVSDRLQALAARVPAGERTRLLVANARGWERSDVAVVADVEAPWDVVDATTGAPLPSQWVSSEQRLYLHAENIPALGYRTYDLVALQHGAAGDGDLWHALDHGLEGPFYRVLVDPQTGTIRSLYDKVRARELVDASSSYGFNEALYWSQGQEYHMQGLAVTVEDCGPVLGRIRITARVAGLTIEAAITLYAHLDRVDIENRVHKPISGEKQELDLAFPFHVPRPRLRLATPGALIAPETDYRPGAGLAYHVARHFVDLHNDDYGVLWTQRDGLLVEFGHRTTMEDPAVLQVQDGTLLAVALENAIDWKECVHDQTGETDFLFRYSLSGHAGGFDALRAVRFGWDAQSDLLAVRASSGGHGLLSLAWSPLQVHPANVVLSHVKPAEEGGLLLRLWECSGQDADACVDLSALGPVVAAETDPLERLLRPLPCPDGIARLHIRGRGFACLLVRPATPGLSAAIEEN